MSTEQRLNFVAVNKTFQGRRKVLLDQRQGIYVLLQRPKTRYNNAEDIITEFLKVPHHSLSCVVIRDAKCRCAVCQPDKLSSARVNSGQQAHL